MKYLPASRLRDILIKTDRFLNWLHDQDCFDPVKYFDVTALEDVAVLDDSFIEESPDVMETRYDFGLTMLPACCDSIHLPLEVEGLYWLADDYRYIL